MFTKSESSAKTLKAVGFLNLDQLAESILPHSSSARRAEVVKDFIKNPCTKLSQLFIYFGLSERPNDWSFKRLYHPDLMIFFVAYLNWHSFDERVPSDEYTAFFVDVFSGAKRIKVFIPNELQKQHRELVKRWELRLTS